MTKVVFPTLLQLGPVSISSLGFFSFLGFLLGAFVFWQKAKEENLDEELALDLWIVSAVAGFLTGRLVFCLTNSLAYAKYFLGFFEFVRFPGFSIFGAFLGMVIVWIAFCKRNKWDFWKVADVLVFGILVAQVFYRLGQFFDGSFFGRITSLPWALHFPGVDGARHPIQIYEVLFLGLLYFLLLEFERQYRLFRWYQDKRGETKPGFLVLTYFLLYVLWRLGLEFLRESSLYFKGIAWEQAAGFIIILISLVGFYARSGRELKSDFSFLRDKREKLKPLVPTMQEFVRRPKRLKKKKHIKKGLDAKR